MVVVVVLVDGVVTHTDAQGQERRQRRQSGKGGNGDKGSKGGKGGKAAKAAKVTKAAKAAKAATQQNSMVSAGIAASRDTTKQTAGRRSEMTMAITAAGAVLLVTPSPSAV